METNFEAIKREAEELMGMCGCPDEAKVILADMVKDEDSLVMYAKVISVFCSHSELFMAMMLRAITSLEVRIRIVDNNDDDKETVN